MTLLSVLVYAIDTQFSILLSNYETHRYPALYRSLKQKAILLILALIHNKLII